MKLTVQHCATACCLLVIVVTSTTGQHASELDDWDTLDRPVKPQYTVSRAAPQQSDVKPQAAPEEPARSNAKITLAFEEHFCKEPHGIFWKQFTRLGKGKNKLLLNESASVFKLHANGHRHMEGALATLTLLRRHEMISYIGQGIARHEDVMCLEMYIKESCMPPMVLAIATPLTYREMLRNHCDVKELTERIEVKEDKIKDWPHGDLLVFAEHQSYFYDMMTRPMLSQVFGGVAFQKQKEYFRGLQITSENSSGSHSKVVRFWFALPTAEKMEELTTLLMAAFAMVNQVANFSISAERQKQAEQVRQEFAKASPSNKKEPGAFAKEALDVKKANKNKRR